MERNSFEVWQPIAVRWGDMDAFGHVNNACYFTYCESARIHYFAVVGLEELQQPAVLGPAVVSATCNFRQQVHYPAELEVGVRTSRIGGKSFTLEYGIFERDREQVVADGTSVVVWVDYQASKALPLPTVLVDRLRALDSPE